MQAMHVCPSGTGVILSIGQVRFSRTSRKFPERPIFKLVATIRKKKKEKGNLVKAQCVMYFVVVSGKVGRGDDHVPGSLVP